MTIDHPSDTTTAPKPAMETWSSASLDSLFRRLDTTAQGLTEAEARKRQAQYGPNEPAATHRTATLVQFLRFFLNPLVLILLIASFVSALVGETVNAAII